MSDSAQVLSGIQSFLQRKTADTAKSTLFEAMPTFELFTGLTGGKQNADGLGRLSSGMLSFGRINGASASRRLNLENNREYLPLIQVTKPSKGDAKDMDDYDFVPVVPNADTTNRTLQRFKQPRFKFARTIMPAKIWHSEMETAAKGAGSNQKEAASAIRSVYDVENKGRVGALCELLNDRLFQIDGQTGAPTDEDAVNWSSYHSLFKALGTDNLYGGIDRSNDENSWWRGNHFTDPWTGSFEAMIDYCNYDYGMTKLGLGVKMILVDGWGMKRAKAEAKTESTRMVANPLNDPVVGFNSEVVVVGAGNKKTYIVYEPAMDTVYAETGKHKSINLDPSTWSIAIPGKRNFKQSKILRLNEVDSGGDEADEWNIEHQMLIACEVPRGNAIFDDLR